MGSNSDFEKLKVALREILKSKKIRYRDLARELGISEQSIKRLFAGDDCSLERLEKICQVLGISFFDLVKMGEEKRAPTFTLSETVEAALASDPALFSFFQLLLLERSVERVMRKSGLKEVKIRSGLRRLEDLGILELHPHDHIRWKVVGTHNWLMGGPLQRKFSKVWSEEFLDYLIKNPSGSGHYFTFSSRHISNDVLEKFIFELKDLVTRYRRLVYLDEKLKPSEELKEVSWIIGCAPFQGILSKIPEK